MLPSVVLVTFLLGQASCFAPTSRCLSPRKFQLAESDKPASSSEKEAENVGPKRFDLKAAQDSSGPGFNQFDPVSQFPKMEA
jgi:hypothetical protein